MMGGLRSLTNSLTTFSKPGSWCSILGPDGVDTHFDELRGHLSSPQGMTKNPKVYAVFTTSPGAARDRTSSMETPSPDPWYIQRPGSERREEVRLDDRVVHTDRGLLIRSLHASDAGVYVCVAQEHTHFTHTLLRLTLQLVTQGQLDGKPKQSEDPVVDLRHGAESRQRYKDYLRVMSSPFGSLEEYCDSLWLEKRPSRARGRGLGGGKWKHIQEMKKSRNRRHHREREEERERGRVALTVNFWARVETAKCCMGAVGLGGIDGRLGVLEG
ncbi:semaphorin-3D-like protein [Lates japonicus]|uniref:Semaphorin-3D-like protein n=1 Tax=Lates japonicus TaxID=270547 RepID=A0AAD3RHU7_LATJO|nr:semaphorin-3D-like protein [Lates japonicus]